MKVRIALRIFLVGTVVLLLTAVLMPFNKASASSVIFQDSFDSGNADNWTPISGNSLWQVKDIDGNYMYGGRIDSWGTVINTVGGANINTPDYQIDFDYLPVVNDTTKTTDRNFDFRYVNNGNLYEIHFWGDTLYQAYLGSLLPQTQTPSPMLDNQINHITIVLLGQRIQFILNGTKIIDYIDPTYQFSGNEKIGMRISTGDAYPTEAWFDNIKVTALDPNGTPTPSLTPTPTVTLTPTPSPITTPTPSPTLVPSPTPTPSQQLTVSILRQTDKSWSSQTYDSANLWSPFTQTINSWGCALTSYAMVLKYFGINKLPDGSDLNPGTLNIWLKNNHGYIDGKNSGYLNPLAISSLSKQAVKINKITSFDGLEYSRIISTNTLPLINELNNNRPAILEEPGHYIVATGITTNSFSIIDPYYTNRTDLTYYSNAFTSLNKLIPSKTDLSYILIAANQNVNIQIKDSAGNILGNQFLQQPLVSDDNNNTSGDPLRMVYVQKPPSENYQISLTSDSNEAVSVNLYSYDVNGNVAIEDIPIVLNSGKSNLINLNFNNQNANNSSVEKIVTFDSLISDIRTLSNLHLINTRSADELIKSIMKLQKNYNKKFKILTKIELRFMKESLRFHDKKLINQEAREIIERDIKDLIKSL